MIKNGFEKEDVNLIQFSETGSWFHLFLLGLKIINPMGPAL
jgi:hypothetical protein